MVNLITLIYKKKVNIIIHKLIVFYKFIKEGYENIGILILKDYPKFELFDMFVTRIDQFELDEVYFNVKNRIKKEYFRYCLHLVLCSMLATGFFISGYFCYENLFPVSVVFSLLFIAMFIYISKANEIKFEYFKCFKKLFKEWLNKYLREQEDLQIVLKKNKILIYVTETCL